MSRSSVACVMAGVLLTGLVFASSASAVTIITYGDQDSPLIIDPSSNPTDAFDGSYVATGRAAAFIQFMPVTKRITRVTLGDLGKGAGCGSTPAVRLYIYEHPAGDIETATQLQHSEAYIPVADTPGKLTWK